MGYTETVASAGRPKAELARDMIALDNIGRFYAHHGLILLCRGRSRAFQEMRVTDNCPRSREARNSDRKVVCAEQI